MLIALIIAGLIIVCLLAALAQAQRRIFYLSERHSRRAGACSPPRTSGGARIMTDLDTDRLTALITLLRTLLPGESSPGRAHTLVQVITGLEAYRTTLETIGGMSDEERARLPYGSEVCRMCGYSWQSVGEDGDGVPYTDFSCPHCGELAEASEPAYQPAWP